MLAINNIDRNYKKEMKLIGDLKEGELFEFEDELYIKCAGLTNCMNISRSKFCMLCHSAEVYKVADCKIEYSLIKDKKEDTTISEREYKKYEFCKTNNCVFFSDDTCKVISCSHTAKEFHEWLKSNSYKIIKTGSVLPNPFYSKHGNRRCGNLLNNKED